MIRWEDARLYPGVVQTVYRISPGSKAFEGHMFSPCCVVLFHSTNCLFCLCHVGGRRFVKGDPTNELPRVVVCLYVDQTGDTVCYLLFSSTCFVLKVSTHVYIVCV